MSAEDAKSLGANSVKAGYAYDRGITGKGVTIAIVDTGIDRDGPEFAGRISADSTSFDQKIARCATCPSETIRFDLDDKDGHGTKAASVAAAARDGNGMHGVAYESTILALKIAGPDLNGVVEGSTTPIRESDSPNAGLIAPAVKYAVEKGAFVISMSINGYATGQMAVEHKAAMDLVRGGNRLFVESVSNNVGEDSFSGKIAENLVGTDLSNKDWFLFAIRLDANLQPPSGNGNPGLLADRTLSVVASNVPVVDQNGQAATVTGNSFAAPGIAGGAALLKQYWPQLGGKEISRIMLDTATDLGTPGVDQVYGAGLLNIEKAMQAQAPTLGTASATNSSIADTSIVFSGAFGGSTGAAKFSEVAGQAVVLDKYGRDYAMDVSKVVGAFRQARGGISLVSLAMPVQQAYQAPAENQSSALRMAPAMDGRRAALPPTGRFAFRMSADTVVRGQVSGSIERSDLVTGSVLRPFGLQTQGTQIGFDQKGWSFSVANARSTQNRRGAGASTSTVTVTAPNGFTFGLANATEKGSALGMRGTGGFDVQGANTSLVTVGWAGRVGGFGLLGEVTGGRTSVDSRSSLISFDPVISSGFRLQADHGAFGGMAVFGLTSPLRVERARLNYSAPVAYDLASRSVVNENRVLDLAPSSREMNLEAGWSRMFGDTSFAFGAAYGMNAGNVAGASSAAGWVRLGKAF